MKDRQERVDESLKKAQIKVYKEAIKWKNAFGTPDGQKCLELLKAEFYDVPMITHSNPNITQNRASQRDLVRFVIDKLNFTIEEGE